MRLTILPLLFLLFSMSVHSKEVIDSAFGLKLGDTFDISKSIGQGQLTDGTVMYQFEPTKGFRSFSKYYALMTPKTQKIYSIWAIGSFESDPVCEKEQDLVMAILEKKYGKSDKQDFSSLLNDSKRIDQGNRYVMTKCSGYSNVTIDIRYYDFRLSDIAENERIAIESEMLDSSSL